MATTNTNRLKAAAQSNLQTAAQTRDLKAMLASPAVTGRINEVLGKSRRVFRKPVAGMPQQYPIAAGRTDERYCRRHDRRHAGFAA